jgi:hypothetical protein
VKVRKLRTPLITIFTFFALIVIQLFTFSSVQVASAASDEQEIEALIQNFNSQDVNLKADSVKALVEAGGACSRTFNPVTGFQRPGSP